MKTSLDLEAGFDSIEKVAEINQNSINSTQVVGVFSHHRDVKVALEELNDAGFSNSLITLITRNTRYDSWLPELNISNDLSDEIINFNHLAQSFFQRLFKKGKYFLLVTGNQYDVSSAGLIMGRRRGHSKVWHCE